MENRVNDRQPHKIEQYDLEDRIIYWWGVCCNYDFFYPSIQFSKKKEQLLKELLGRK